MMPSRRDLMKLALTSSAASLFPHAYAQTKDSAKAETVAPGTFDKFNHDGSVRPFAGNTVICHLPAQCALRDVTVSLHDELSTSAVRSRFAVLPADSYHMTVFGGANDQDRTPQGWPRGLAHDMPIEECTRIFNARLESFLLDRPMPIRMKIDEAATSRYTGACSLRIHPADDTENGRIRTLRDRLSETLGIRAADHPTYEFHITIAYQIADLNPEENRVYRAIIGRHAQRIAAVAPIIELGLPEFCSFRDMYRYDVLRYLRTA